MAYQKKDKTEFFSTPQKLVDKMWSYFPVELVGKNVTVFDSCAGNGALCKPTTLPEGNFTFIQWDFNPRAEGIEQHDFFATELPEADIAICNPPFGLKKEWVSRLLGKYKYVILLCTKSVFKDNWNAVVASGKEPDFNTENLTLFKGKLTTPVMIGLLKQTTITVDNKSMFNAYINKHLYDKCNLELWKLAFNARKDTASTYYLTNASTYGVCVDKQKPKLYRSKPTGRNYLVVNVDSELLDSFFSSDTFKHLMYLNGAQMFIEQNRKSWLNNLPFDTVHYKKDR